MNNFSLSFILATITVSVMGGNTVEYWQNVFKVVLANPSLGTVAKPIFEPTES